MTSATVVTFPHGGFAAHAVVQRVERAAERTVVVMDTTPFHPVDHTWPDQPGDSGFLRCGGESVRVSEAVMAAISDDGVFAVGAEIPVRRGVAGWTWLVGHVLDGDRPDWLVEGAQLELSVDEERRAALSRGHSACHLASLALDLAVADLWSKDPGLDSLGNPNFDARANQSSRIREDGAVDEYRLGKSLRKAGFDTEQLVATLAAREAAVTAQLASWVATGAPSRVVAEGTSVVDRRTWRCELPGQTAEMWCGGTHVTSLAEFASITVSLELSDPQLLVMRTTAIPVG